jgi:DNA-binding XRE family transcriptional regulator
MGDVIRQARRRKFLTQTQLAEKLGVRYQTVQQWEKGGAAPHLRYRKLLVELLDIAPEDLVDARAAKVRTRRPRIARTHEEASPAIVAAGSGAGTTT